MMSLGLLSQEQDDLLKSQHRQVILVGNAGAIKTLVLKAKARQLVNRLRADGDSSRVFFVSFTTTDDTNVSFSKG